MSKYEMVKSYLLDMNMKISYEDEGEELVVVQDPDDGINNLVIDCEDPIVVLEQRIMPVPDDTETFFKRLLQMNRSMVHGAFVIDDEAKYVIFRDTLQLENLDHNELEASVQALSLALAENGNELLEYIKH